MDNRKILKRQLDAVDKKNLNELIEKFQELFGFTPNVKNVRNLRHRIAYRLQEIYFGGISDRDLEILVAVANKDELANLQPKGSKKLIQREGTRFRRIWNGTEYEVRVNDVGKYEFKGKTYKSLSAVARQITGTHWNGLTFFGVNRNG